jgi:hypothetical protein
MALFLKKLFQNANDRRVSNGLVAEAQCYAVSGQAKMFNRDDIVRTPLVSISRQALHREACRRLPRPVQSSSAARSRDN